MLKYCNFALIFALMKTPLWKKWLSYLAEIPLETASSEVNDFLHVSLVKGRLQLSTEHAIYSYEDLYDNFLKAFRKIDLDRLKISDVLILGFGLGSIPYMLEKIFQKQYYYTAVEIDPTVLQLANRYTVPNIQSGMEFVCMDAWDFAEVCSETYDLIAVDLFLDDKVPEIFEQPEYLEQLKNLLNRDGFLMFNRLAHSEKDIADTNAYFENVFLKVFPQGCCLDVDGNYMLISCNDVLI